MTKTFDKAFLVAPTTAKVKDHMQAAMLKEATDMKSKAATMNFKEAYTHLENYADFCTYAKAKQIVDLSLDETSHLLTINR